MPETSAVPIVPESKQPYNSCKPESGPKKERALRIREAVELAVTCKDGYVAIPRSFITKVMPHLKEGELKAALVVYLDTDGRSLVSNTIPLDRFAKLSGLCRRSVAYALQMLAAVGLLSRTPQWDAAGDPAASIYRPTLTPQYEKKAARGVVHQDARG